MNKIREVLKKKGIRQRWLAERLGKSCSVINDYCTNRRQPRLDVLIQLSQLIEVKLVSLIDEKYLEDYER